MLKLRRIAAIAVVALAAAPAFAQEAAKTDAPSDSILNFVIGLGLAVIALLISLGLAMFAVKTAINMFDKVTKDMDEWEELKKGNVAVGILLAGVILAVGTVISGTVGGLTESLTHPDFRHFEWYLWIVLGIVNLLIGLWVATYVIGLAIRILDKMTEKIEEMQEIAKGNVAVAIMVVGVLLAVSSIVSKGVEGISKIARVENVAHAVGIGNK